LNIACENSFFSSRMLFLGSVSAAPPISPGLAFAKPGGSCLPYIETHRRSGQSFAVWGQVPFVHTDGQAALLSGRLFNASELSGTLGVEPVDEPMLVLHAYRRWGADLPKYLDGEYAFAVWDGSLRRLILARDPAGQQPLHYSQQGEDLRFSNQIGSLLKWPGVKARPDERSIAHWLALAPADAPRTFFEEIFSLPPGHALVFENGRTTLIDSWQPGKLPWLRLRDSREYADGMREKLQDAVRKRLQPSAVTGSQLSGGLDSSSVTALAAGLLQPEGRRIFAFTAVPRRPVEEIPGKFTDEGPHAAAVAAMYPNVDHILVRHGHHTTFSMIDRFSSAMMLPAINAANYDWIYEIGLQARRRGVQTLLTGERGNLTISYHGALALPSLVWRGRFLKAAKLAGDLRRAGSLRWRGAGHRVLRPWMPDWLRQPLDRARGVHHTPLDYSLMRRDFARSYELTTNVQERQLSSLDVRAGLIGLLRRSEPGIFAEAMRQLCGVSSTDPTADRQVMEYCLSVPDEYFCEKGVPRSLIRNAMTGLLPEQVRTERRRGIQAADFGQHFKAEMPEALNELARMKKIDLAVRALDLPKLESMMYWSEAQIAAHGTHMYWIMLTRALSLGRFLRRLEDGTLFTLPEESDAQGGHKSIAAPPPAG
jgi:asparagine synthase (glutamine-hydrolysing)